MTRRGVLLFPLAVLLGSLAPGCDSSSGTSDAIDVPSDVPADVPTDVASDVPADVPEPAGRDGLMGWHTLGPEFLDGSSYDGMSFEWDYFMIHDEKAGFTGSIGYLIANPRRLDDLFGNQVPKGANVAVAGRWPDGKISSEYVNFGYEGFQAGNTTRSLSAGPLTSGAFARMTPDPATNRLRLEGQTDKASWDLTVWQGWPALSVNDAQFVPVRDATLGALSPADENWNVNMVWPYTRITGTLTNLATGTALTIDGHGYRENSWGRWAFNLGGWDFAVVGDKAAGVMWAWQTYHFNSTILDYLDLAVQRDGVLDFQTFRAADGQLGWRHDGWRWDATATQCVPRDAVVIAQNAKYRVEAQVTVGDNSAPMLSDATDATKAYVIFILFPTVSGTVTDRATGDVVATFSGQGGGEFATARSDAPVKTEAECASWGTETYSSPMPQ